MPINPVSGTVTGAAGGTAFWETQFFDINGNVTQPTGASINIAYYQGGIAHQIVIMMAAPTNAQPNWTAQWDTRGVDPGRAFWFLYTTGPLPKGVSLGSFVLLTNNATLSSF